MNLAALITEVKARGFDHLSDARITQFINDAYVDIAEVHDWTWLETSTSGNAPLSISDLRTIVYVIDTSNDRRLRPIRAVDLPDIDTDISRSGTPEWYWIDAGVTIKVFPVATVALSVRYLKVPASLSGTDTPVIPTRYHNTLVDQAVVWALKDANERQEAASLQQEVNLRLLQMIGMDQRRSRDFPDVQSITYGAEDW